MTPVSTLLPFAPRSRTRAARPSAPRRRSGPRVSVEPSRRQPRRQDESGTIVLWVLGLCVLLLAVGGIAVDLWRAADERRAIAALADAAAHAGASGIDEAAYRASGAVVLDPPRSEALAGGALASAPDAHGVTGYAVDATPEAITVAVQGQVPLTLLRLLTSEDALEVAVTSVAAPRRVP